MHSFAWSPDGRLIAYVAGNLDFPFGSVTLGNIGPSAIWIVPARGGAPVRLTDASALNTSPAWLPDSRSLLFISNRDGPRDVYRVSVRRGGDPAGPISRLTFGLGAHSVGLTADGRRLAYSVYSLRSNVWAVPLAGEGVASMAAARQITTGNQMIETFTLSHAGKWIYFDSDRSGNQDLYRIPATGGEAEQLTTDRGADFLPNVTRDGRAVVFHGVRQSQGGRRVILERLAAPSASSPQGRGRTGMRAGHRTDRRYAFR
jgi:Tol biopolymer transport system component